MASSTELRDRATRLARTDAQSALALARKVPDPWFRAQALAGVARAVDGRRALAIASESLAAAAACDDDYRRSAVAAWPIRALAEHGEQRAALAALAAARARALASTPMGSRAEALVGLLQGAWPLGPGVRRELVEDLVRLRGDSEHWRVGRAVVDALGMLSREERDLARQIAERIDDPRCRTKALARIEADEAPGPRSYF